MTHQGRIIIKENGLRCFKERADDIRRFASVIRKAFLNGIGIVHISYTDAGAETLRNMFGSCFIE